MSPYGITLLRRILHLVISRQSSPPVSSPKHQHNNAPYQCNASRPNPVQFSVVKFRSLVSYYSLNYNISFNFRFCSSVNEVGNLTLYCTMKFPLVPGFLLSGMPQPGNSSWLPGCVGPPFSKGICLPSMVVTVRFQPVRASLRSRSTETLMSSPSRV